MHFIGRQAQIDAFLEKRTARQGGVFAIKGGPGLGKSTLLWELAQRSQAEQHPAWFLDLEDLETQSPDTGAAFLADLAHLHSGKALSAFDKALAEFHGAYQSPADLLNVYGEAMQDAAKALEKQVTQDDTPAQDAADRQAIQDLKGIAGIAWTLGQGWQKSRATQRQQELGHPERFLLEALAQSAAQHPVLFVDTYEHLRSHPQLRSKTLFSHVLFSKYHQGTVRYSIGDTPQQQSLPLWLEGFFSWLAQQGVLVVIAGRHLPAGWAAQAATLQRFNHEDMLQAARANSPLLAQAAAEQPEALLAVLQRLSFDGNPLWLQVGMNMLNSVLDNGEYRLSTLADNDTRLRECFEAPTAVMDDVHIEHAACKLQLFQHVTRHIPDLPLS